MTDPKYVNVKLIIEDATSINTIEFLKVPGVDIEALYEPDTQRNVYVITLKPLLQEIVSQIPGEQTLYRTATETKILKEVTS
jgi:uncharacterized protein YqfB (UPF0267 family)